MATPLATRFGSLCHTSFAPGDAASDDAPATDRATVGSATLARELLPNRDRRSAHGPHPPCRHAAEPRAYAPGLRKRRNATWLERPGGLGRRQGRLHPAVTATDR